MDFGRVWGKRKRNENVKLEVRGINMTKRYFIGGFTWENESQKDRFLTEGIWENGYDDKFKDVYDRIRIGDYIGLKSTYVKQRKSWLRIHSIGEVKSVSKDSMLLCVNWFNIEQKDITGITWYADTLCEITNKSHIYNIFGMNDLKEQVSTFSTILVSNHNLILTGAPGTGKTYLAKQIAQQMIFGEIKEKMTDEERKQFDEQCDFVQFHPSYDYTDFVEGLRPKQYNGNVGFELKDGVFKEFCAKAIRNFEDSKKTQQVLIAQQSFADKYNVIINKINDGSITKFDLKTTGTMEVVDVSNRNSIILRFAGTTTNRTYTVSFKRISILSESFPDVASLDKMNNIYDSIQGVIKGCNASAYWAVLREIYKQCEQESSQRNEKKELQQEVKEKPYVFIIDEINRGEISKIFGELFFSIDPGYRGTDGKVRTQYANMQKEEANDFDDALGITDPENYGHFFVPENVYIIGTMNDIDRSVESMDFAFRRRFAFKEIKATDRVEMLDDLTWKDEAVKRMNRLNAKIEIIEGLSSAYHIGPAYFLKLKNYNGDFDQLWENHLEGLLREYLRGMQNLEEKLKTLKAAYDNESDSDNGQQQD